MQPKLPGAHSEPAGDEAEAPLLQPPRHQQQLPAPSPDSYVDEEKVPIPEGPPGGRFSWRKLWAFTGPGFLMSIAYLDPGNIESDLRTGTLAGFELLWLLLLAHSVGLFMQRLAARLGVVTGRHLAEAAAEAYPTVPRIALWLMVEIAIVGSDMQEVIGTAIAFSLLSGGRLPLWVGVLITAADAFTFLLLDRYGLRKLEAFFGFLIAIMAAAFGYEAASVRPEPMAVVRGLLVPGCRNCGVRQLLQAVGMIGAVIMPHNIYLHSALVKSRDVDRQSPAAIREANFYYLIESAAALATSFLLNLCVVCVFAQAAFGSRSLRPECLDRGGNSTAGGVLEMDIYKAGLLLGCEFGPACGYIWALGILAAGQSSTMTGTYAGQFVMEGFLKLTWTRWQRVLLTRSIAILPTVLLAALTGVDNLTGLNDLLNALMSLQLPFALIPLLTFTASPQLMPAEFRSGPAVSLVTGLVALAVIAVNFFLAATFAARVPPSWAAWTPMALAGLGYASFLGYLVWRCLAELGVLRPLLLRSRRNGDGDGASDIGSDDGAKLDVEEVAASSASDRVPLLLVNSSPSSDPNP